MIGVRELAAGECGQWKKFLEASSNGTLFHDLEFLAYNRHKNIRTRHLVFCEDGRTAALLPAAVVASPEGGAILESPYGASVGGMVLPPGQPAEQTRRLIRRLREYAAENGLRGIEMRIGPPAYLRAPHDHLGYALFAEGFQLIRRRLCQMIDLPAKLSRSKARDHRMGLRRGLVPFEAGPERLPDFYRLLVANKNMHRATPTHTQEELADLFRRVPGRLRLFLCEKDGCAVAGILVFALNARVAYTFYIARDGNLSNLCPVTVLLPHVAEQMFREGVAVLDLGPSTDDDLSFNSGLAVFKAGFGALGHCREAWRWERG